MNVSHLRRSIRHKNCAVSNTYQFKLRLHQVALTCARGFAPQAIRLVGIRNNERVEAPISTDYQPSILNPSQGVVKWPDYLPTELELAVTFFRKAEGDTPQRKKWVLEIEHVLTHKVKPLASVAVNLSEFGHSKFGEEVRAYPMNSTNPKIEVATLHCAISWTEVTDFDSEGSSQSLGFSSIGRLRASIRGKPKPPPLGLTAVRGERRQRWQRTTTDESHHSSRSSIPTTPERFSIKKAGSLESSQESLNACGDKSADALDCDGAIFFQSKQIIDKNGNRPLTLKGEAMEFVPTNFPAFEDDRLDSSTSLLCETPKMEASTLGTTSTLKNNSVPVAEERPKIMPSPSEVSVNMLEPEISSKASVQETSETLYDSPTRKSGALQLRLLSTSDLHLPNLGNDDEEDDSNKNRPGMLSVHNHDSTTTVSSFSSVTPYSIDSNHTSGIKPVVNETPPKFFSSTDGPGFFISRVSHVVKNRITDRNSNLSAPSPRASSKLGPSREASFVWEEKSESRPTTWKSTTKQGLAWIRSKVRRESDESPVRIYAPLVSVIAPPPEPLSVQLNIVAQQLTQANISKERLRREGSRLSTTHGSRFTDWQREWNAIQLRRNTLTHRQVELSMKVEEEELQREHNELAVKIHNLEETDPQNSAVVALTDRIVAIVNRRNELATDIHEHEMEARQNDEIGRSVLGKMSV